MVSDNAGIGLDNFSWVILQLLPVILPILGVVVVIIFYKVGSGMARRKGRSTIEGGLLGLFLCFIGLIIEALLPSKKKCPYCAEYILEQAVICRYCGKEQPTHAVASNLASE
jgi:hypothetical protein